MHHKINNEPTPIQSQVALSAKTADIDNEQTDNDMEQPETQLAESTKEKQPRSFENQLFIRYRHEKRFRSFKREMHRVHENVFRNTPAMDLRLVVGNRNCRDTKQELIRERPKTSLLQNMVRKIQSRYFK